MSDGVEQPSPRDDTQLKEAVRNGGARWRLTGGCSRRDMDKVPFQMPGQRAADPRRYAARSAYRSGKRGDLA